MLVKIFGQGFIFGENPYLNESWNILDFVIVTTSYLPLVFADSGVDVNLKILRSLRVLRPLRTVTKYKDL